MDALKKAEEEKKRAARQLQEVEEPARDEELPEEQKEQKVDADTGSVEERVKKPASDHLELTLEPIEAETETEAEAEEALTEEEEKILNDTHEELVLSREIVEEAKEKTDEHGDVAFSEGLTLENTIENEMPEGSLEETQEAIDLEDTGIIEGLSSDKDTEAPFSDTFHGLILEDDDDEGMYEETLPGVSADQLAKDLGGGVFQPTPVAAKTVFSAGASKKKSSFKWGIFTVLVVLALGSFAVFYYFSITPVARKIPPPDVARGIESTPAALPAIPPVTEDNISGTLIAQNEQSDAQPEEMAVDVNKPSQTGEQPAVGQEAPVATVTPTEEQGVEVAEETLVEPEQAIAETAFTEEKAEEKVAELVEQPAPTKTAELEKTETEAAPVKKALPEYLPVEDQAIRISKSNEPEKKSLIVKQGFDAFQRGDYALAKSMYEEALKLDKDNRDAHLGLAATAVRQGKLAQAFTHYNYLLGLNPDDALALTAMQSLNKQADPVRGESAIKILLRKEGDNPYLYFNLGNLYARQKRWPEAQQAFFDAFRLDSDNAEYALNLAISLDHLEQYAAALNYYESALALATGSDAIFDAAAIRQRVQSLTTILQAKQ